MSVPQFDASKQAFVPPSPGAPHLLEFLWNRFVATHTAGLSEEEQTKKLQRATAGGFLWFCTEYLKDKTIVATGLSDQQLLVTLNDNTAVTICPQTRANMRGMTEVAPPVAPDMDSANSVSITGG